MKKFQLILITVVCFSTVSFSQNSNISSPQVRTANGVVQGVFESDGVNSFKGIPFAAPPVGMYRWREPQPVKSWSGVLTADHFAAKPMQTNVFGDMNSRSRGMSEDCLYLNVWSPNLKPGTLLPVLVYFYGGGFVAGDASEPRYDGESMATKGIVALTVNYRLGIFGFFSHPALTAESPYHASGNYGLLDMAAALQWVQRNIAAFGGDPKRVTIAGESAGSVAVSALMASPLSKDLIAGAIGESGSIMGTLPAVKLSEGEQAGVQYQKTINANTLADLRAIPSDSLLMSSTRYGVFRFPRTVDGYFFPEDPTSIFMKGHQAHVPLLVGWNSEEMNYRVVMGSDQLNKENYEKAVRKLYNDKADKVLALYTPSTDNDVEQVATELAGDRFIGYSTWKWSDAQTKTGGKPVFRYLYERARPAMRQEMGDASPGLAGGVQKGGPKMPAAKGAVHSSEIEYAMGNLGSNKIYDWSNDDYKVSKIMQQYFANFIIRGNPNGPGLPPWPSTATGNAVPVMHINVDTRVVNEQHRDRYIFMDAAAGK